MLFKILLGLSALLGATAAPAPEAQTLVSRQSSGIMSMTGFRNGCSPGGCIATFTASAADGYEPGAPGFSFLCQPIFGRTYWQPCQPTEGTTPQLGSAVSAIFLGGHEYQNDTFYLSHTFSNSGLNWNITAYVEGDRDAKSFTLPVISIQAASA